MKKIIYLTILVFNLPSHAVLDFEQQLISTDPLIFSNFIQTYDMDGDGDLDIYSGNGFNAAFITNFLSWLENDEGEFLPHRINFEDGIFKRVVKIKDSEFTLWGVDRSDESVTVTYYEADDNFKGKVLFDFELEENHQILIHAGDFNGDKLVDFISFDITGDGLNSIYEVKFTYHYNIGDDEFLSVPSPHDPLYFIGFDAFDLFDNYQIVDLNDDGLDDLVVLEKNNSNSGSLIYFKSQDANEVEKIVIEEEINASVLFFDIHFKSNNSDGLLNVYHRNFWYELHNDVFIKRELESTSGRIFPGENFYFEDYDIDGDFDLITFPDHFERDWMSVYENESGVYQDAEQLTFFNNSNTGVSSLSKPGESLMSFVSGSSFVQLFSNVFNYRYELESGEVIRESLNKGVVKINDIDIGDIDGDGIQDVIAMDFNSPEILLLKQSSQYQFEKSTLIELSNELRAIKLSDIDGDGDLDLFVVSASSEISFFEIYLNNGSGIFSLSESVDLPRLIRAATTTKVELLDINNDGQMDITEYDRLNTRLAWYKNERSSFEYEFLLPTGAGSGGDVLGVDFGDLDGDGDLDVVYSYVGSCNFIICNRGTGYRIFDEFNNNFQERVQVTGVGTYENVYIENITGNSANEVIFTENSSDGIRRQIFSLQGSEFTELEDTFDPSLYVFAPHDINQDGVVDFMIQNDGNYEYMLSDGGFNWSRENVASFERAPTNRLAYKDIDDNGEIDIISALGSSLLISFQGGLNSGEPIKVSVNKQWALLLLAASIIWVVYYLKSKDEKDKVIY